MVKLTAFIYGSVMHLYWGYTHIKLWNWTIFIKLSIFFKKKSHFTLFSTCMHNVLWDTHTINPVLHKLCKLVPISRPFSQWGIWVHVITWYYCHILTAEPHFDSQTEKTHTDTHTEYLNTSSTEVYLPKMANELRPIRTYVLSNSIGKSKQNSVHKIVFMLHHLYDLFLRNMTPKSSSK